MTWTESVQRGKSPPSMCSYRSRMWWSESDPASCEASSAVRFLMPCCVLKWYLTQNRSPTALIHW
ncbi:Uncharacterised protein [Mycobacteroides abscessus]|nr:Uncharacterised protein [Mycobacteroides abscessus]